MMKVIYVECYTWASKLMSRQVSQRCALSKRSAYAECHSSTKNVMSSSSPSVSVSVSEVE